MRIAVIGATGALGREIVAALAESAGELELESTPPVLLATPRSAGETFPWLEDEDLAVEETSEENLRGTEVAVVAVPPAEATAVLATLRSMGIAAADATPASRSTAPLFLDSAPPQGLGALPVLALPGAEALQLARILLALRPLGPKSVRTAVFRAASGAGHSGVSELAESTGKLLNGQEPEAPRFPHRLAFNAIPQVGAFQGASTEAEAQLSSELSRLVGAELRVGATVAWAPWFYAHLQVGSVALASRPDLERARELLRAAPGLKLVDDPAEGVYPMPSLATGDDAVLVGRLREDGADENAIAFVSAMDNVRACAQHSVAALAAVARARAAH